MRISIYLFPINLKKRRLSRNIAKFFKTKQISFFFSSNLNITNLVLRLYDFFISNLCQYNWLALKMWKKNSETKTLGSFALLLIVRSNDDSRSICIRTKSFSALLLFRIDFIWSNNPETSLSFKELFIDILLNKTNDLRKKLNTYYFNNQYTFVLALLADTGAFFAKPKRSALSAFFNDSGIGTPNFCARSLALSSAVSEPSFTIFFSFSSSVSLKLSIGFEFSTVGEITILEGFLFRTTFLGEEVSLALVLFSIINLKKKRDSKEWKWRVTIANHTFQALS